MSTLYKRATVFLLHFLCFQLLLQAAPSTDTFPWPTVTVRWTVPVASHHTRTNRRIWKPNIRNYLVKTCIQIWHTYRAWVRTGLNFLPPSGSQPSAFHMVMSKEEALERAGTSDNRGRWKSAQSGKGNRCVSTWNAN